MEEQGLKVSDKQPEKLMNILSLYKKAVSNFLYI